MTAYFVDIDEEFQTALPNKLSFLVPEFDDETGEQIGFTLTPPIDEGRFEIASGDFPAIVFAKQDQIPRRAAQLTVEAAKVIKVGPWIEPPPPPPPANPSPSTAAGTWTNWLRFMQLAAGLIPVQSFKAHGMWFFVFPATVR